jgi:isopenicillin N synthase-like dioxygenase
MSRSTKGEDDLILARAVDLAEIPRIDFAPFLSGDEADRRRVADEIGVACRQIGFFYLTGHGVPDALRQAAFNQSAAFFHKPIAERARSAATPEWYRGWIPMPPPAPLSRSSRLFEQYRIQLEYEAEDEARYNHIFYRPNRWPEDLPAFGETCAAYLRAMLDLSRALLRAFALGLGLPEDRFDGYFDKPLCQLSLLYYIPLPPDADVDVSNTVSHTDEGPLTILAQDRIGGLEVKRRDGAWIAAPPVDGAYVINIGDMMMWWSNGRYLSNYHRVKNRAGVERFSIPFFLNPDRDVVVEPLPEFLEDGEAPAYAPVKVGDHLARFYATLEKDPRELDR